MSHDLGSQQKIPEEVNQQLEAIPHQVAHCGLYKNDAWHFFQAISFVGHERAVKTAVNAYRQTARDARESDTEVRDAQFVALVYRPSQTTS